MLNRIIKGAIAGGIIAGSFGIVFASFINAFSFHSTDPYWWTNFVSVTLFSLLVGGIIGALLGEAQKQISALTIGITVGAIAGVFLAIAFTTVVSRFNCSDGFETKGDIFINTFYSLPIGTIIGWVIGGILELIFRRIPFFAYDKADS